MIRRFARLSALAAAGFLAVPAVATAQEDDDPEMTFEEDDLAEEDPEMTFEEDEVAEDEVAEDEVAEDEPTFEEDDLSEEEPSDDPFAGDEIDGGDEMTFEEDDLSEEPELSLEEDELSGEAAEATDVDLDERKEWEDIVVVMRKPFLKRRRIELLPMVGVTTNDNLIRHTQLGGQLNYFLTDVLAVGLEGALFQETLREPFELVARQARRLPTVNKYNYGAALNFHYTPAYGKLALFDRNIIHWDASLTAGVGVTESEVIPRNPALQSFKNMLVTPNVGASMRVYFNDFLTINFGLRDYVFLDQYEALDRTEVNGEVARDNATSSLVNHVVFQAGLAFWLPTSFSYSTFR